MGSLDSVLSKALSENIVSTNKLRQEHLSLKQTHSQRQPSFLYKLSIQIANALKDPNVLSFLHATAYFSCYGSAVPCYNATFREEDSLGSLVHS